LSEKHEEMYFVIETVFIDNIKSIVVNLEYWIKE